jgi:type IV pilus assembly protein PilO
MAKGLDAITSLPPWQMGLVFVLGSGLLGAGWYTLYYEDAVNERTSAESGLAKAKAELATMDEKLANFEQEMAQAAEDEKEIEAAKSVLPLTDATIDHLMREFQQQARLVGLNLERWSPGGEKKLDFYAKMPVEIEATGTWHQAGEFFRRVSELQQIVTVENVKFKSGKDLEGTHRILELDFTASTFRFLADNERGVSEPKGGRRKKK